MAFSKTATRVDRDDYDVDHYADCIRDSHRTRLTFESLDIARRQHRGKEKLLSQAHAIAMKEHTRLENDFLRKLERNARVANLPVVRKAVRAHQRQGLDPSPPPASTRAATTNAQSPRKASPSRASVRPPSARTERLNANRDKFDQTNAAVC